jgi:hypothetical protein
MGEDDSMGFFGNKKDDQKKPEAENKNPPKQNQAAGDRHEAWKKANAEAINRAGKGEK